jgi:hydrogenase nickel incorporation protein HypA/HybF
MHEASLMKDLMRKIESVARESGAKRVSAVKVSLGALSHMTDAHFREHFDISSRGTLAEGASLRVTVLSDEKDPRAQDIILDSVDVAD